jgi:hypothetical protein
MFPLEYAIGDAVSRFDATPRIESLMFDMKAELKVG